MDAGYALDFSSGSPVAGPFMWYGGHQWHSTLSDPATGALLFRTDGRHVYNALNDTMLNGSFITPSGDPWQTLIISTSDQKHVIATLTSTVNGGVLRYSEVDMSLDGGSGGITANKAIHLSEPIGSIAAFSSTTRDTTWLMATVSNTHEVLGFAVHEAGVDPPFVAQTGSGFYGSGIANWGKNDRSNSFMALQRDPQTLRLLRCDRSNGTLYDAQDLTIGASWGSFEFSPSGEFLYVEYVFGGGVGQPMMAQFHLFPFEASSILASKDTLATYDPNVGGGCVNCGLQLAPDGTIVFHSTEPLPDPDSAFASRIRFPDLLASACGFEQNAVFVGISPVPDYGFKITPSLWWPALAPDVSVNETSTPPVFTAYPNPTTGLVNVSMDGSAIPDAWRVHDLAGREVMVRSGFADRRGTLDLATLSPGMYVLSAWSDGQRRWSERIARQ